jgi:hypothetical protein
VYPQERISFNPHPKTLTMAGDYEYFAAQGYHPLAFALAELIDNSLRATKGNRECCRDITVSLITDDKGSQGVICVSDNGSGMTTQELNNWAVMNLSMEDRGLLNADEAKGVLWLQHSSGGSAHSSRDSRAGARMPPPQLLPGPAVAHAARLLTPLCLCARAAGSRYLSSDISYFGVGSKNAAFYLGRTVKVVTKTQDSAYVHELCIQGGCAQIANTSRAGRI